MKIEKKVLNDALRILGKVVCQTSPVEVFRGVRFVGTPGKVLAMATDGVEWFPFGLMPKRKVRRSSSSNIGRCGRWYARPEAAGSN